MIPPVIRRLVRLAPLAILTLLCALPPAASAEILVKTGDTVAFLGDSITAQGWGSPAGYVKLVVAGLAANGVNIVPLPAGIGGQKSNDMLARLDRDVLSKQPQWMTLSCGVNDVWHGAKGVPLDDTQAAQQKYEQKPNEVEKGTFERNIATIVETAQAAGVKVVILTATVIQENLGNDENKKLAPYNDFLRKLAKENNLPLADLNVQVQERIKAAKQSGKNVFTRDGVHMNTEGNKIMATGVLQAFGLDAGQIKKAEEAWAPLEAQAADEAAKVAKAAADKAAPTKVSAPASAPAAK